MGWDGMGWDGMGWDGMGWDGMGWNEKEGRKEGRKEGGEYLGLRPLLLRLIPLPPRGRSIPRDADRRPFKMEEGGGRKEGR
jgi:hypothetical protein